MPVVAITGATGFIGSALTQYFLEKGWRVVALVRDPQALQDHKNLQGVKYDMTRPVDPSALKKVDYVVHAAYVKKSSSSKDAFEVNVKAADNILQAAQQSSVKKRLFISSMSAHKEAASTYGKQKLAIERLFNQADDIIIRPGLVIGNGGVVRDMITFMRTKHIVPIINGGNQPIQPIDVRDLCIAVSNALETSKGGIFTVADSRVYAYKEFYSLVALHLGIQVYFISVPYIILLAVLKIVRVLRLPLNITEENLRGLKRLRAQETATDLNALNVRPRMLASTLDDLKLT